MVHLEAEELNGLKLFGNRVLIKLPAETDEKNQTLPSGIVASFLYSDKEKYAPVQGVLVKRSPSLEILRDGDHVFFHYLCWGNAQHTSESFKNGHYDGTKLAIECEGAKYLLMSETEIFFAKREERYVAMNDYVLLRSIPKNVKEEILKDAAGVEVMRVYLGESNSNIATINLDENYHMDIAEVAACPEGLGIKAGDIIMPEKHWNVPLEYDILQTLGETLYYVNKEVILAKQLAA